MFLNFNLLGSTFNMKINQDADFLDADMAPSNVLLPNQASNRATKMTRGMLSVFGGKKVAAEDSESSTQVPRPGF